MNRKPSCSVDEITAFVPSSLLIMSSISTEKGCPCQCEDASDKIMICTSNPIFQLVACQRQTQQVIGNYTGPRP